MSIIKAAQIRMGKPALIGLTRPGRAEANQAQPAWLNVTVAMTIDELLTTRQALYSQAREDDSRLQLTLASEVLTSAEMRQQADHEIHNFMDSVAAMAKLSERAAGELHGQLATFLAQVDARCRELEQNEREMIAWNARAEAQRKAAAREATAN